MLFGLEIPSEGLAAGVALILGVCLKWALDVIKVARNGKEPSRGEVLALVKGNATAIGGLAKKVDSLVVQVTKLVAHDEDRDRRLGNLERRVEKTPKPRSSP